MIRDVVVPVGASEGDRAAWTLRSLLARHPGATGTVHVVHLGADLTELRAVAAGTEGVDVREVRVDLHRVAHLPAVPVSGRSGWLVTMLPELVEADRVFVLAAGIDVVDALDDLEEIELHHPVAAVGWLLPRREWPRLTALRLGDPVDYFGIGVLVLDLDGLRGRDLLGEASDVVAASVPRLGRADRDVLNVVFAGGWQALPARFGVSPLLRTRPALAEAVFGPGVSSAVAEPAILVPDDAPRSRWDPVMERIERVLERLPRRRIDLVGPPPETQVRASRRVPAVLSSADDAHRRIVARCLPHTMVSAERLLATVDATNHLVDSGVPGALVECGVWRGGSALAMVLTLLERGVTDRDIHLFDTFEGMTEPTAMDTSRFEPRASDDWARAIRAREPMYAHLFADHVFGAEQVRRLLEGTGYPADRLHLVAGPVEQTIPERAPAQIALLRLDTDWYVSTRHELEQLYPRLAVGGVLAIDDYGHWDGARRATDEYFAGGTPPLLFRTDYSGRMMLKPSTGSEGP